MKLNRFDEKKNNKRHDSLRHYATTIVWENAVVGKTSYPNVDLILKCSRKGITVFTHLHGKQLFLFVPLFVCLFFALKSFHCHVRSRTAWYVFAKDGSDFFFKEAHKIWDNENFGLFQRCRRQ